MFLLGHRFGSETCEEKCAPPAYHVAILYRQYRGLWTGKENYRNVKDSSGNSIAGASVSVKNFKSGVSTDGSGHFSLSLPAGAKTLIISSVGFDPKEVAIGQEMRRKFYYPLQEILCRML